MFFVLGTSCMLLAGAAALPRARRELSEVGGISGATLILVLVAYGGHAASAIAAAYVSEWPLTVPVLASAIGGGVLLAAGALLYGTARFAFRSFRLTWGLRTDRLVSDGLYAWSRNPQSVGWALVLLGAGLMGRSGSTLALAVLYWTSCLVWVPLEERVLHERLGKQYDDYRKRVPRWFGVPRVGLGGRPGGTV